MSHILLKSLLREIEQEEVKQPKRTLSYEEALKKIPIECSETIEAYQGNSARLYRGDNRENFLYIDPTKNLRKSANTSNFYTALISLLGTWKKAGIPERSKSVVFSNGFNGAFGYGSYVHMVFPVNGAKIAHGTATDNWNNHRKTSMDIFGYNYCVSNFNDLLQRILASSDATLAAQNFDLSKLQEYINQADEALKNKSESDIVDYSRDRIIAIKKYGLWNAIKHYIDPVANGIEAISIKDLQSIQENRLECWTDSPCYFISTHNSSEAEKLFAKIKVDIPYGVKNY